MKGLEKLCQVTEGVNIFRSLLQFEGRDTHKDMKMTPGVCFESDI